VQDLAIDLDEVDAHALPQREVLVASRDVREDADAILDQPEQVNRLKSAPC
jgi:hypothetical protein